MNENIKKSRLLFELARKQNPVTAKDVVAGDNAIAASRLIAARNDFAYSRNMAEVAIGNEMLDGKNLQSSVESVIEKSSQHESVLGL